MSTRRVIRPEFSSAAETEAYLKRKVSFLLEHAAALAAKPDLLTSEEIRPQLTELEAMKASLSWRLTKPLRDMNYARIRLMARLRKRRHE